mgnify:CR=1 FL=1
MCKSAVKFISGIIVLSLILPKPIISFLDSMSYFAQTIVSILSN